MKKMMATVFICTLLFPSIVFANGGSVTVAEDCWMEQRICIHWHHLSCDQYGGWIAKKCETSGYNTGDCRVECEYNTVINFDSSNYYTKAEINDKFDGVYEYLDAEYYDKSTVDGLFSDAYERITAMENYIAGHEQQWSQDTSGASHNWVMEQITEAIESLRAWVTESITALQTQDKYLRDKANVMDEYLQGKFGKEYCDYEAQKLIDEYGWETVECGGTTYFSSDRGILVITPA